MAKTLPDRDAAPLPPPEWRISAGLMPYPEAVAQMEARAAAISAGTAGELIWLLEHPPLYTKGTSARPEELLDPSRLPVFETGRGGRYTYHGPGQRVGYVMLDLKRRNLDIRRFVRGLEAWTIETLKMFGVSGERRAGRIGIWVARDGRREDKIAAIGVRVRRGVTYHGLSINVAPDLGHYRGIVPCGLGGPDQSHLGVTSLADLDIKATMRDIDAALMAAFERAF